MNTLTADQVFKVEIKILCGEYEKNTTTFVKAQNKLHAESYAIYLEAHEPSKLEWCNGYITDLNGEFAYKSSSTVIANNDIDVISRYFDIYHCQLNNLLKSGNFPEILEDNQPPSLMLTSL